MRYTDRPLKENVEYFISSKSESDVWDFKQEWHENTAELIKDIICFANTVHDEDCYIIMGVSDDYEVVGMEKPRRKQSDIIDALSKLKYAGDNIPEISVKTVMVSNKEIDVCIVHNTNKTPIYLKEAYGNMRPGCIYCRIKDKNTPDKGNAEIHEIEMLWKKRMGLTKPPLEYLFDRLANKTEWNGADDHYYNIYRPDFSLQVGRYEDYGHKSDEYYAYSQVNESMSLAYLDIKVGETTVDNYELVTLDSGRLRIPTPQWGFIPLDAYHQNTLSYKYFIEDSNHYKLVQFFYNPNDMEECSAFNRLMNVILLYRSDIEKELFEEYATYNVDTIKKKVEECKEYSSIVTETDIKTKTYKERLKTGSVLHRMLEEWRQTEGDGLLQRIGRDI